MRNWPTASLVACAAVRPSTIASTSAVPTGVPPATAVTRPMIAPDCARSGAAARSSNSDAAIVRNFGCMQDLMNEWIRENELIDTGAAPRVVGGAGDMQGGWLSAFRYGHLRQATAVPRNRQN